MVNIWYLSIVYAAFTGFLVAFNIWFKKRKKQPIVCPLHFNCDMVVHSNFSTFFHIPLEYLGMAYYALTCLSYIGLTIFPRLADYHFLLVTTISLTVSAFLFSLYLTFIQIFLLRQWCSWCLISALLCSIILVWTFQVPPTAFIPYLSVYDPYFFGFRIVGIVLGLVCCAIANFLFIRFLKDGNVSAEESEVVRTLFEIVWFCLGFVVLATITLYLTTERFIDPAKFLLTIIIILVIIASQSSLSLLVLPKLRLFPFREEQESPNKFSQLRKLSFTLSIISVISWCWVLMLEFLKYSSFSSLTLLGIYVFLLVIGVSISRVVEVAT